MPKKIDLTGQRFGRYTVVELAGKAERGKTLWKCRCDCGKIVVVKGEVLTAGRTTSCGCYREERRPFLTRTHGDGNGHNRLYRIWAAMKRRCYYAKGHNYKNYGGRGIRVCEEWKAYESFRDWALTHGYTDELTIDRIDVNGHYEPYNCRWIPMAEQSKNRRCCKNQIER